MRNMEIYDIPCVCHFDFLKKKRTCMNSMNLIFPFCAVADKCLSHVKDRKISKETYRGTVQPMSR